MSSPTKTPPTQSSDRLLPFIGSLALLAGLIACWHHLTIKPIFQATGLSEEQLMEMEFNGDIIQNEKGDYVYNPSKLTGFPTPLDVWEKIRLEMAEPFHTKGTNDHGIALLVGYTLKRFAVGFIAASLVAIAAGILIGLSRPLFLVLNPYIQVLKVVSPLAWMPLLLYTVKNSYWTAILVVFMASLWPTMANTAFGVQGMRKDYLHVARMLELSWPRRLFSVVLPAIAPAVVAGLRISFGSALIAVVPAEMLLGELGVGYLTWTLWNNSDVAGVIFGILVVGVLGFVLDSCFQLLAGMVRYAE